MDATAATSVFIVEDHEVTRLGLRILLEDTPGFTVAGEAADGWTAVEKVLQSRPKVVLMDVGLPRLDGIAVTKQIKEKLPDVRVIMFTSHDSDDDIFAAFAAGADGYCLKESSVSTLIMAISSVASGAGWLHPGIARQVLGFYSRACPPAAPPPALTQPALNAPLSEREMDVLRLVVEGLSNQEIAERLYLSVETVKSHMRHIMEKLSVADRTQAAVKAIRSGLL